ncbi:hypothetical protein GIB67_009989 [Kingdonia uniflora]|uniref:DUF4216 domain-containing protein n=1 Tax=Kingdonia uniflora TaxID=39325 RepID=A0A7J7P0U7_9MAGN|nr:hypothetical protein GIB67_009989 [Kingdonia uniflora]
MRTYKDYVKNPKRVEGCIANCYVLDEAILYCMEYIPNGRKGTHKRGRPTFMDDDADKEQPLDKGNVIHLETLKYEQVRRWVLSSYDGIEEWEKKYDIYLRDYMRVSRRRGSTNVGKPLDYILWLREQFENLEMSTLKRLVDGLSFKVTSYKAYRVNGFVFCTADSESCKTTQNSGVKMKAMTNFVASTRDQNPREAETIYYGVVKEIIELDYYDFPQTIFYCDWVRVEDKVNGCAFDPKANLTFVNLQKLKRNSKVDDEPYCLASQASQVFYCQDPTRTDWSLVIDAPKRLDKNIDAYEEPFVFETGNPFTSSMMGLINENVDEDEEITEGSWIMISPSQSTPSLPNPSEPLPIPAGESHDEHSTTSGGDEVDQTIIRSDSFLVGHTHSDGTFPTALVAEKVSTELLRAQIMEGNESYIDLENRFSQYKTENDAKLDSLRDMVTSLRSFERAATPTVNVDRSRMFSPLLREEAIAHFLDLHENIESEEAEYEVIVDIIFEQGSPVFGQCGVFFDELLIGTKIKYPKILLRFGY